MEKTNLLTFLIALLVLIPPPPPMPNHAPVMDGNADICQPRFLAHWPCLLSHSSNLCSCCILRLCYHTYYFLCNCRPGPCPPWGREFIPISRPAVRGVWSFPPGLWASTNPIILETLISSTTPSTQTVYPSLALLWCNKSSYYITITISGPWSSGIELYLDYTHSAVTSLLSHHVLVFYHL